MKPNDYISYKGKEYPLFQVDIIDQETEESAENMEFMTVTVATQLLSDQLIDSATGMPVDKSAERLDNEIFFYIPDELAEREACEIADYVSDNCW